MKSRRSSTLLYYYSTYSTTEPTVPEPRSVLYSQCTALSAINTLSGIPLVSSVGSGSHLAGCGVGFGPVYRQRVSPGWLWSLFWSRLSAAGLTWLAVELVLVLSIGSGSHLAGCGVGFGPVYRQRASPGWLWSWFWSRLSAAGLTWLAVELVLVPSIGSGPHLAGCGVCFGPVYRQRASPGWLWSWF